MCLYALLLLLGSLAVADASKPACDDIYVKAKTGSEYRYLSKELTCKKRNQEIVYGNKRYDKLKCESTGWKHNGMPLSPAVKGDEEFKFACATKACDQSHIHVFNDKMEYENGKLKCKSDGEILKYTSRSVEALARYLTCDQVDEFWKDEKNLATSLITTRRITVSCVVKAASSPCTFTTQSGVNFDGTSKKLTCDSPLSNQPPKALEANSKLHLSITCDANSGWKDGSETIEADPKKQPVVQCVEYCAALANGRYAYDMQNGEVTAKCPAGIFVLNYGDSKAPAKGTELTCSLAGGWKDGNADIEHDHKTPIKIECKEACNTFKNGALTGDAENIPLDNSVRIECREKKIGKDKNRIKLNGNAVFSHVKCDAVSGYTDMEGKILAGAFDEVNIECDKLPCQPEGTAICTAVQHLDNKLREYDCSTDSKPFEISDDPNRVKCNDEKKQKLYDATPKKFYERNEKHPTCDNTGKWTIDNAIVKTSMMICMRKRCNTCAALGQLSSIDGEMFKYTDGTIDTCALATCEDNLWRVTKPGGTSPEEYAGEVVCSSAVATQSKWLIDGDTQITAGSCITKSQRIGLKCTEAAKLNLGCDGKWADCEQINPDNNQETRCQAGKKMFYMQRDAYGFEEDGEKIECDKTKGVWKIAKIGGGSDSLKRGGTVVCAISNPKPTTTTLAPTTTTAFVKPCDACFNNDTRTRMFQCATCSDKPSDMMIIPIDDEKCSAKHYNDGEIRTEIIGNVKEIECSKFDKIWKTKDGKEVGKFAAYIALEKESEGQLKIVVGGAIGGVVLLIILFAVIFKVFIAKKQTDVKEEETKRKKLEESRKKKQKAGSNDEILDGISVDAPSELKL